MKKLLLSIASALLGVMMCTVTVHAEEALVTYDDTITSLLTASGTEDMLSEQGMDSVLEEQGIRLDEPETLQSFSFRKYLEDQLVQAAEAASEPIRMFGLLLGVILLSAFSESLQGERSGGAAAIYEMICALCAVGVLTEPISAVFLRTTQTLQSSADFMLAFSTIFGGVLAVCGGLTSAAGYQAAMIGICEIAMQLAAKVMIPVLSMGLAMSIVDAVNPVISLEGMIKLMQKVTVWLLGFLMTIFLGFLSVQSMVSVSTDKLSTKTTRFLISNLIPFVGGAVSDAYSTVLGSMGVLKSATGMIGILSVLSLLLPLIFQLGIYRLLIAAGGAVAEMFAVKRLLRLLRNVESILATAFSVAVSFSVMFVVSTAIMLLLGGSILTT